MRSQYANAQDIFTFSVRQNIEKATWSLTSFETWLSSSCLWCKWDKRWKCMIHIRISERWKKNNNRERFSSSQSTLCPHKQNHKVEEERNCVQLCKHGITNGQITPIWRKKTMQTHTLADTHPHMHTHKHTRAVPWAKTSHQRCCVALVSCH